MDCDAKQIKQTEKRNLNIIFLPVIEIFIISL